MPRKGRVTPYGELVLDTGGLVGGLLAGGFLLFGSGLLIALLGGYVAGIAALVDVARTPSGAFGPWWDNTKSAWAIGIAVAFSLPFGPLVVAILWFGGGRRPLRWGRHAGRPFWVGPPRPYPPPVGHAEQAPRWDAPGPPGWEPTADPTASGPTASRPTASGPTVPGTTTSRPTPGQPPPPE